MRYTRHLVDAQQNKDSVVCGFSGTNDTKHLLPLPVIHEQVPDPHLVATNGKMLYLILKKVNSTYLHLPSVPALPQMAKVLRVAVEVIAFYCLPLAQIHD